MTWNHVSKDGMATNKDPHSGGIVDKAIVSGKWFYVANHPAIETLEEIASKEQALTLLAAEVAKVSLLLTRKQAEAELWRSTHKDYKGQYEGNKSVLILRNGGTTLCPLASLTDAELADRVKGYQA